MTRAFEETATPASEQEPPHYDALLMVGFGGPEAPDHVLPFLENVTRGRRVPRDRLLEVARHYDHFGGVSPINGQMRALIAALRCELDRRGIELPIYWGNRNWHPLLADTMRQMAEDGTSRVLAFVMSAYGSYSSCRQYLEDIESARDAIPSNAPRIDKLRAFHNHPEFIEANVAQLRTALAQVPEEDRTRMHVAFTAHSLPESMAQTCDYERQLTETCRLVAEALDVDPNQWALVYQSRSGRPSDPWLGPDILDHLRALRDAGMNPAILAPIGFLSDHMEVLYDLDFEARQVCDALGLRMIRAATVGTHVSFVRMIGSLVEERLSGSAERRAVGRLPPCPDICPDDCCPAPTRPRQRSDPCPRTPIRQNQINK